MTLVSLMIMEKLAIFTEAAKENSNETRKINFKYFRRKTVNGDTTKAEGYCLSLNGSALIMKVKLKMI